MRKISLLIIPVVISILFFSCMKDKGTVFEMSNAPSVLEGNWVLVNDSTTITPWGIWAGQPVTGINYIGTSADYFHFTNTTVTYSEKGVVNNATYSLKNNLQLYLGFTSQYGKDTTVYKVSNLTGTTMTLSGDTSVDPEQIFSHILNLKKVN